MVKLRPFDRYVVDLDHYSLRNGSDELFIEPRLIRLLDVLLQNSGEVVRKQDLMDSVWEDVMVSEDSLPRAVTDLKKVLANSFSNPPEIQTIRKVGYKLVPAQTKRKSTWVVIGKVLLYLVGAFLVYAILIRALNY